MKKINFLFLVFVVTFAPKVLAQVNQTTTTTNTPLTMGLPEIVSAQAARDWHEFHKFHVHVEQAIHEVQIARSANRYGMGGHSQKAEDFLYLAEKELRIANNSTNSRS